MKVTRTFTFIVSPNFGHPMTWNIIAWRVYAGGAAAVALAVAMIVMSILFLVLNPRLTEMQRQIDDLLLERDDLRKEAHAVDQQAYDEKVALWEPPVEAEKKVVVTAYTGNPFLNEDRYVPPLRLGEFRARVRSRSVEAIIRIIGQGKPDRQRGGFLFVVFENREVSPMRFVASPKVATNEKGFPEIYKAGIRFSRVRTAQTYRRKISRRGPEEYYTHATVYLFSLRGGLLAKHSYPLERELFINDA